MKKILNKTLINQKVKNIGESISKKFIGKKPIFIGVLKGSFIFTADLLRYIKIDCQVEFIKVQSYKGTQSTGNVKITSDIKDKLMHFECLSLRSKMTSILNYEATGC